MILPKNYPDKPGISDGINRVAPTSSYAALKDYWKDAKKSKILVLINKVQKQNSAKETKQFQATSIKIYAIASR